jgi:hypothetical protein
MQAVETVKADLRPQFEHLIDYLGKTDQVAAAGFFTQLLVTLISVKEEEDLLGFFIELSTTAFVGLQFDDTAATMIDAVLEHAQQVAKTFSVSAANPH